MQKNRDGEAEQKKEERTEEQEEAITAGDPAQDGRGDGRVAWRYELVHLVYLWRKEFVWQLSEKCPLICQFRALQILSDDLITWRKIAAAGVTHPECSGERKPRL